MVSLQPQRATQARGGTSQRGFRDAGRALSLRERAVFRRTREEFFVVFRFFLGFFGFGGVFGFVFLRVFQVFRVLGFWVCGFLWVGGLKRQVGQRGLIKGTFTLGKLRVLKPFSFDFLVGSSVFGGFSGV